MSTINKEKMLELIHADRLITRNFNESRIKEACYEASTSCDFFEITVKEAKKVTVAEGDCFILRPNNQVVCVTKEYFNIPKDMIARVFLVGHYFSLGIAPVSTYADPGFKGRLGIVLSNTSKNYIKISPNEQIAKIEFATMSAPSHEGYVGQHGGEVTTWPFRSELIASKELLASKNINPDSSEELDKIYGVTLRRTINEARKSYLIFGITNVISIFIPLFTVWGIHEKWNFSSPVMSIAIGVATGIIANYLFYILQKGKAPR